MKNKRIQTYDEFYKLYLKQHTNTICRLLHVIGTTIVIVLTLTAIYHREPKLLILVPLAGYGFCVGRTFLFSKK